jgi:hypothetical protein
MHTDRKTRSEGARSAMIRWSDGVWSDEYMAKELQGMGGILVRPPDRGRGRGGVG